MILENIREPINLTFLKNMPRLKILYINSIFMMEDEFDFQNNKALEFVYLSNIRSNQRKGIFELTVKNLPKSLQYIDLSMSPFIILNDNLFNQLKDINWVIIDDFKYYPIKPEVLRINDQYIKNHQFIKATDDSEEILPEKYQRKQIYGLFGLE